MLHWIKAQPALLSFILSHFDLTILWPDGPTIVITLLLFRYATVCASIGECIEGESVHLVRVQSSGTAPGSVGVVWWHVDGGMHRVACRCRHRGRRLEDGGCNLMMTRQNRETRLEMKVGETLEGCQEHVYELGGYTMLTMAGRDVLEGYDACLPPTCDLDICG